MLRLGAALIAAVLLTAQAPIQAPSPIPSQTSPNQQGASANTGQNQQPAAQPVPLQQIQAANPKANSGPQKNAKTKEDSSWRDWFSNNDHWIVIGTLILAGAAVFQVEIARRTAKRQLRAYVLIDGGNVYDLSGIGARLAQPTANPPIPINEALSNFIGVSLTLKNSGQTPARNVVHWSSVTVAEATNEHLLSAPAKLEESQASVVGPGQITTKTVISLPFPLTEDVIAEIAANKKGIYVYGRVTYWDIFKRKRETTYRLRYSGAWPPVPNGTFLFSLHGNDFR